MSVLPMSRYPRVEIYNIIAHEHKTVRKLLMYVKKNTDRTYRTMFGMERAVEVYIARLCEDHDIELSEEDIAEITKDILENGL